MFRKKKKRLSKVPHQKCVKKRKKKKEKILFAINAAELSCRMSSSPATVGGFLAVLWKYQDSPLNIEKCSDFIS